MYVPMVARASMVAGVLQPILSLPNLNLLGNDTASVSVQAKDASYITDVHHTHTPFHEAPAFTQSVSFYHAEASQSFAHMHAHPEVLAPYPRPSSSLYPYYSTTTSEWQAAPTSVLDQSTSFWSASETEALSLSGSFPVEGTPTRASEALMVTEIAEVHTDARNSSTSSAFGAASENPFEHPIFVGTVGMMFFALRVVGLL